MKNVILLSLAFTAVLWQNQSNAQCSAPLTITPTSTPGEAIFQFDLNGMTNPSAFYAEISIYNTTTSTSYNNVYVNQNTNPYTYQFAENGTYDLWVSTWDSLTSCLDTVNYNYVVTDLPNTACDADFSIVNDSLTTTEYYGFNYSTGTNLTYAWDFGDGGTSTDQFPVYTFSTTGTFDVCLTIDDGNGCTDTECITLTVFTKASQTTISIHDPGTANLANMDAIENISVYPNPSNGDFTISFYSNSNESADVNIFDLQGNIIASQKVDNNTGETKVNFDLNGIAPGVYFWQLNADINGKLIVE